MLAYNTCTLACFNTPFNGRIYVNFVCNFAHSEYHDMVVSLSVSERYFVANSMQIVLLHNLSVFSRCIDSAVRFLSIFLNDYIFVFYVHLRLNRALLAWTWVVESRRKFVFSRCIDSAVHFLSIFLSDYIFVFYVHLRLNRALLAWTWVVESRRKFLDMVRNDFSKYDVIT